MARKPVPRGLKLGFVSGIMWAVNAALLPVGIIGVYIFGPRALGVITVCVLGAVATEAVIQKIFRHKITVSDGSAFCTGLLLAYTLPSRCPFWLAALASFFAIAVGKQAFGGLGKNIFNPALAGRALLMFFWPESLTSFTKPFVYDALTQATPLIFVKSAKAVTLAGQGFCYLDLFVGNHSGAIGEVCIFALVLAGLYLLFKRIITLAIPLSFILTTGVFMWIFGAPNCLFGGDFLFYILSGGLVLGAVFMATDYVTSPVTTKGKLIFGIGCGFLTACIRLWGSYPEGVCYAILVMNAFVPFINWLVHKRGEKA